MGPKAHRTGDQLQRGWTPAEDARIRAVLEAHGPRKLPHGTVPRLAADCDRTVSAMQQRVSQLRHGVVPADGGPAQPRRRPRRSGQHGARAPGQHRAELLAEHPPEHRQRRCAACRVPFTATSRFVFRCDPCRRRAAKAETDA